MVEHTSRSELFDESDNRGHAYAKMTRAAAALFDAFNRADSANQRKLIGEIIDRACDVAQITERWSDESIADMRAKLYASAARAKATDE